MQLRFLSFANIITKDVNILIWSIIIGTKTEVLLLEVIVFFFFFVLKMTRDGSKMAEVVRYIIHLKWSVMCNGPALKCKHSAQNGERLECLGRVEWLKCFDNIVRSPFLTSGSECISGSLSCSYQAKCFAQPFVRHIQYGKIIVCSLFNPCSCNCLWPTEKTGHSQHIMRWEPDENYTTTNPTFGSVKPEMLI